MEPGLPFHVDEVEPASWDMGELAATRRRLGVAAGAIRLGVAIIEVPPGKRPTPVHSHTDEEELFLVLEGSGFSYLSAGSKDARAYEIGVDDVIWHPSSGDAHTLIAGEEGLTVLVVAEGSRTGLTWLPRTRQFWIGPRWSPPDTPPPFVADSELPPLEVPRPTGERPATIRNLAELPLDAGSEGKVAWATRDAREMGSKRLVLAQDDLPAGSHNTDLHFHSAREECWFVRGGSGVARLGEETRELVPGSFWLRSPDGRLGHRIEAGPKGLDLITMGDLIPGDVCAYPEKGTVKLAGGVEVPYSA